MPDAALPSAGGGGGCGVIPFNFLFAIFTIPLLVCLYPLATISCAIAIFFFYGLFQRIILPFDPTADDVALGAGLLFGLIALYKVARREPRLAQNAIYRLPRHYVRLVMFGLFTLRLGIEDQHFLPRPGQPFVNLADLRAPVNPGILLVAVGIFQLALWKVSGMREFWHGRMRGVGLGPSDD